jgi:hypothetical protein
LFIIAGKLRHWRDADDLQGARLAKASVPRAGKGTDNAWFHLLPDFEPRIKSRQVAKHLRTFDFGFGAVMPGLLATSNMISLKEFNFLSWRAHVL